MLDRKITRIAHADDLLRGVMAEHKSRERDRGRDRFQMSGRHRDDQALDLTVSCLLKRVSHRSDVPVQMQQFAGDDRVKGHLREGDKISTDLLIDN
jgi:hypothetical protein